MALCAPAVGKTVEANGCLSELPCTAIRWGAAAIASALSERKDAHIYRNRTRHSLNLTDHPGSLDPLTVTKAAVSQSC
jgi:hypothetical protein